MLHRIWPAVACALFLSATPFPAVPARADDDTKKGAATPKDLMLAVGAALAKDDIATLKGLIAEKGATPQVVDLYANLLHVDHVFAAQRARAIEAFGKDIAPAVDAAGGYLAKMHIDFAKLAEAGKLEKGEEGETKFSYADESQEESEADSYSVDVLEIDGRWYLDSELPKDPAEAKMMVDLVSAMVPASKKLNHAIKEALAEGAGDAAKVEKFRAALQAAGAAFQAAMDAIGEPGADDAPPKDGAEPPKK